MAPGNRAFIKVIVLGDRRVGKTSLMNQYVDNKFSPTYKSTIGTDFSWKEIAMHNRLVTMQIWDNAGQAPFHALGVPFYRDADACALVYDVSSPSSFWNLNAWRDEFLSQVSPRNPDSFPFLVIANKIDMDCRQISPMQALQWCEITNNMPYFETSAKDKVNVATAFQVLAEMALTYMDTLLGESDMAKPSQGDQTEVPDNPDECQC